MHSLQEILLPADFSARSVEAARWGAGIARHFGSRITLLHVLPPIHHLSAAAGYSEALGKVLAHHKQETRDRMNLFLKEEFDGLDVQRIVLEGDPAEMIAGYAASEPVDLIMMATRGCGTFRLFILGSVTAKVLHDAQCPVWTSPHVADGGPAAFGIPKVIACAVDLNSEGAAVLRRAAGLASSLGARLVVVHAIPSLEFHPETYFLEADMRTALLGEARSKITNLLQASPAPAEVRVEGGRIPTVVRSVVEDTRAGLLVIGRPNGGAALGRLRTHSYALIRESPCPVISI